MKYNSIVKCTHHKLHKGMINFSIIAKDKIYLHFFKKKKKKPKDFKNALLSSITPASATGSF